MDSDEIISALQDDIQYITYKMKEFEQEVDTKRGKGDIFVSLVFKSYDNWAIESYRRLLKDIHSRYTGALRYLSNEKEDKT